MKTLLARTSRTRYAAAMAVLLTGGWLASQAVRAKVEPTAQGAGDQPKSVLTVSAVRARPSAVTHVLSVNGSVAAWQEASLGSEVDGLRLTDVRVNVGDVVQRGQVLAVFDASLPSAELAQARASLAEAQAQATDTAANAQRARELEGSGAMSVQQIQQRISADEAAQARLMAQRALLQIKQVRLQRTQVLAPDAGVISSRSATLGAVLPAGQELFRLIRQGRLEWRAEVPADQLMAITPGSAVTLWSDQGQRIDGRVRVVAPTVDTRSRTGQVYVDIPAASGTLAAAFKAGMFARGEFALDRHQGLTLPNKAVLVRDGFSYVFRLKDDQHVTRVKVQTGRRLDDQVEVLSGLDATTRVAAGGVGFLNDGDLVKVVPALPASNKAD